MVRHMATRTLRHFFLLDWATTVWTDVSHLLRSLLFQKTKGVTPDLNHIAAFEDLLRLCRLAAYEHWPHAMKNGLCAAHFDQGVGWQDAGVFEKVNVCRLLRANLGFIHENFFSARHQVAWVFDPHSDEEGCFGWRDGRTKRLTEIKVMTRCKPEIDTARQEPTALPSSPRPEPAKKTMTSRARGKLPGFVKAIVVLLLLAGAAFFLKRFLPERMLGFFDWKDRPATWIVLSLCLVVLLRFAMRLRVNRKRSQERAKADQSSLTTCKPEGKTAPASAEKRKP